MRAYVRWFFDYLGGDPNFPQGGDPAQIAAWLAQADWYVDEQHTLATSSDDNDGRTPATALVHQAEVVRRLAGQGAITPVSGLWTLHYISTPALPTTTFQWPDSMLLGQGVDVLIQGPAPTPVRLGALSAYNAINKLYGTAAMANLADGVLAFTAGQRITNTTVGARFGARGFVASTSATPNVGQFQNVRDPVTGLSAINNPIAGDTYQLETLAPLTLADNISPHVLNRHTALPAMSFQFADLDCGLAIQTISAAGSTALPVFFDGCKFSGLLSPIAGAITFNNCFASSGNLVTNFGNITWQGGVFACAIALARPGTSVVFQGDAAITVPNIGSQFAPGAILVFEGCGIFATGDGCVAASGASVQVGNFGSFLVGGGLYGQVTGTGVVLRADAALRYLTAQIPVIAGAVADWTLPNAPAYFDAAARTYPLATAATPNTWVNLGAAQPGGFGTGNAYDPDTHARILKAA